MKVEAVIELDWERISEPPYQRTTTIATVPRNSLIGCARS